MAHEQNKEQESKQEHTDQNSAVEEEQVLEELTEQELDDVAGGWRFAFRPRGLHHHRSRFIRRR